MDIVKYTAQLDLTDNGCFDTGWRIKQGDYGNSQLMISLVDNGVNAFDANVTPQINFKRPDGKSVLANMTVEQNVYSYIFVGNELEIAGTVLMDVKFITPQGRTSSASCKFTCVEDTIGIDPTGASTYYNPVSETIEEAKAMAQEVGGFTGAIEDLRQNKQNKLIAGRNITIDEDTNTISASGGGGGGGTSDYNDLDNKPKINGITLSGNKSTSDLGINIPNVPNWALQTNKPTYTAYEVGALPNTTVIPTQLSQLGDDSTHRLVTDAEKEVWNTKGGSASIDYGDETAFNEWSENAQNGEIFVRTDDNEGGGSFAPKFEYTREGITVATSGINITGGGYYEWGNVVVVNLNLNITAAASSYSFNGFPKAVVATNINPVITSTNGGNSYPSLWGFINTSGQMQMRVNPVSADLMVGKNAIITAQYLKAE